MNAKFGQSEERRIVLSVLGETWQGEGLLGEEHDYDWLTKGQAPRRRDSADAAESRAQALAPSCSRGFRKFRTRFLCLLWWVTIFVINLLLYGNLIVLSNFLKQFDWYSCSHQSFKVSLITYQKFIYQIGMNWLRQAKLRSWTII